MATSPSPEACPGNIQAICTTATNDPLPGIRQRITQPKDAIIRFHLTLNGFIIKYLTDKGSPASTEELLALARENLSVLRRIDGSQYKPSFTRVFGGTLDRCPAFKKSDEGWVVVKAPAEEYKQDILRHIYRRMSRTTKRPIKTEEKPEALPSAVIKLPSPQSFLPRPREYPEGEESPHKVPKTLGVLSGFQEMLLVLGVQPSTSNAW